MAQPIAKNPVLLQLPTGLYLGLVCYNALYENLKFVLEKRDFFEMEWPALIISQEKGLFPVLLGLPYISIQRPQILWYTTYIPAELLKTYQGMIPFIGGDFPQALKEESQAPKKEEIYQEVPPDYKKRTLKKGEDKIVPFPLKPEQRDEK